MSAILCLLINVIPIRHQLNRNEVIIMLRPGPGDIPSVTDDKIQYQGVQYEMNPGAEYGEHIANTTAICNSSVSHTYGNVIALIEKYLLDEIMEHWNFHTVTVSTSLTTRQVRHVPRQLRKKSMPMMVLLPRISFGQEDNRFLGHTLINDQIVRTHALWGDGSLIPLATDPRKQLYVHGKYQRAVMYIDVIMAFDTFTEQTNAMSTLHNMASINHPQDILAPLELYIPEEFCKLIGNLAGTPINDDKEVYKFLSYMNSIWDYPITYKLKGGSNTNEFFMYYLTDILTMIQDPQPGPGIKDGQIRRGFDINFTVRCDFNTVGYFTLNHPELKRQVNINPMESDNIVPIFSDSINLNDFPLPAGWSVLSWPIFKLSPGENSISIDPILNDSLRTVIDYHLKMHIPIDRFLQIQFRENGEILSNEGYFIDWANRKLILNNPNPRRTYRLIVTTSVGYINELIKSLYYKDE